MKKLFVAALAFVLSTSAALAQGVPVQWQYSFEPSGQALATYPGDVLIKGALTTNGSGNIGVIAANNTALMAMPASYGTATRYGYANPGDGPPLTYTASNSPCALNSGAGDGGWQVPTSDGLCWIANFPTSGMDIKDWGAASSNADNSVAVSYAVNAASNGRGGGHVLIPATFFKVAQTASLDLSSYKNVSILCSESVAGQQTTSILTAPCTLQINAAYSVILGQNFELGGIRIANQSIELASTVRLAISEAASFTGTGVIANSNDVNVHDVQINGFSQAFISTNAQRIRLDTVAGDDTNFVSLINCNDACEVTRNEAWPFVANNQQPQTYSITGVTNSGGLFDIAYNNSTGIALVTGDKVILYGLAGTSGIIGRYTITVIDSTHFTLNGSTFASGYSSGGSVYLSTTIRSGTAYSFTGSGSGGEGLSLLWEYGHDICMNVGAGHGPDDVHYLWCDGDSINGSFADNVPTGFSYNGNGSGIFGGFISGKAISIAVNSANSFFIPLTVNGLTGLSATGCASSLNANSGSAITIFQGAAEVSNSYVAGMNVCSAGYDAFALGNSAHSLKISSTDLQGAGFFFSTPANCNTVSIDGLPTACPLPTLTVGSGSGTGAVVVCASGYACGNSNGRVLDVLGTAPAIGPMFTINFGVTKANAYNCNLQSITGSGNITAIPGAATTSTQIVQSGSVPVGPNQVVIYNCGN